MPWRLASLFCILGFSKWIEKNRENKFQMFFTQFHMVLGTCPDPGAGSQLKGLGLLIWHIGISIPWSNFPNESRETYMSWTPLVWNLLWWQFYSYIVKAGNVGNFFPSLKGSYKENPHVTYEGPPEFFKDYFQLTIEIFFHLKKINWWMGWPAHEIYCSQITTLSLFSLCGVTGTFLRWLQNYIKLILRWDKLHTMLYHIKRTCTENS